MVIAVLQSFFDYEVYLSFSIIKGSPHAPAGQLDEHTSLVCLRCHGRFLALSQSLTQLYYQLVAQFALPLFRILLLQYCKVDTPGPSSLHLCSSINSVKMSSTSKKHRNFVDEPMGNKDVTQLAGIGDVLGKKLRSQGYSQASSVYGQYLVMQKDEGRFRQWAKNNVQANTKQSSDCYKCLNGWDNNFRY